MLDVYSLSKTDLRNLAGAYDKFSTAQLGKFTEMGEDHTRSDIDAAFCKILGLPKLDSLRKRLALEPIITLRPCTGETKPPAAEDQFELALI